MSGLYDALQRMRDRNPQGLAGIGSLARFGKPVILQTGGEPTGQEQKIRTRVALIEGVDPTWTADTVLAPRGGVARNRLLQTAQRYVIPETEVEADLRWEEDRSDEIAAKGLVVVWLSEAIVFPPLLAPRHVSAILVETDEWFRLLPLPNVAAAMPNGQPAGFEFKLPGRMLRVEQRVGE